MVGICLAWMSSRLSHRIFAFSFFDHFSQTAHHFCRSLAREGRLQLLHTKSSGFQGRCKIGPAGITHCKSTTYFPTPQGTQSSFFPTPGPADRDRRILRPAGPDFKRRICLIPCDPVDLSVDGGAYFVKVLL